MQKIWRQTRTRVRAHREEIAEDLWLFRKAFEPFGVEARQFRELMALGRRRRARKGDILLSRGTPMTKVTLLLTGRAVGYQVEPRSRLAVCEYMGARTTPELFSAPTGDVPVRGWVIGVTGIADKSRIGLPFPWEVVSETDVEFIEWSIEWLFLKITEHRALQTAFYYIMYVQLLVTLDRERAAKMSVAEQSPPAAAEAGVEEVPSARQLFSLSLFVGVPFFGFGFADNFVMIVAGDAIDEHFGHAFGLTTMAAAGLGNWISDLAGLGLGDAIERMAVKMGLSDGCMSPRQQKMEITKAVNLGAKIIGISLGCMFGMCPLFFLVRRKYEFDKEDMDVYDKIFLPCKVHNAAFGELMQAGKRKRVEAGGVLVRGGRKFTKVMLVLHGEAHAFTHDEEATTARLREESMQAWRARPRAEESDPGGNGVQARYVGQLADNQEQDWKSPMHLPVRGVIGGSAILDRSKMQTIYPWNIVAVKHVEWIEWELDALLPLLDADKAIQVCFLSMIYSHIAKEEETRVQRDLENYSLVMSAVLASGVVTDKEKEVLRKFQQKFFITAEQHVECLAGLGWTKEAWDEGYLLAVTGLRKAARTPSREHIVLDPRK